MSLIQVLFNRCSALRFQNIFLLIDSALPIGESSPFVTDTKQVQEIGLARPITPETPKAEPEQPTHLEQPGQLGVRTSFCLF